jgi:hypothetical protein
MNEIKDEVYISFKKLMMDEIMEKLITKLQLAIFAK